MAERLTFPAEAENGKTIIVTLFDGIDKFRDSGKYIYRVNVRWDYNAQSDGMPEESDAELMEKATEGLTEAFRKDPAGVMTGIYTGDGARDWVFYTRSLHIFRNIFNRGLEGIDVTLPLLIEACEDPGWEEYADIRSRMPETLPE